MVPTQTLADLDWRVVPIGALALVLAAWRGWLGRGAFAEAPTRQVGVTLYDGFVGLLLTLTGMIFAGAAMVQIVGAPAAGDSTPQRLTLAGAAGALALQAIGFGPALAFLAWRLAQTEHGWRRFGLTAASRARDLARGAVTLLFALPVVYSLTILGAAVAILLGGTVEPIGHTTLRQLAGDVEPATAALVLVSVVAVAPLVEELIFRGLLQTALVETLGWTSRWPALMIAAAVFATVHLSAVPWYGLPALFAFGVVLGWSYERTGSLWPAILAHAGFNALNVALVIAFFRPDP